MTEKDVITAAALIKARDDAQAWRKEIAEDEEATDYPIVAMEFSQQDAEDNGQGFEGALEVPRDLAVVMLEAAMAECDKRLKALGVTS